MSEHDAAPLNSLKYAMAHYHVAKPGTDACAVCNLDLRDQVHATRNIVRQRKTGSLVAATIANRRGPDMPKESA